MTMEKWKEIKGYEENYCISNTGLVKSMPKSRKRRSGKAMYLGVVLTPSVSSKGYLRVNLWNNYLAKTVSVHRLVAIHFKDNPLGLPEVNHLDGNKANNNDWNLEWSTHRDNSIHAGENNLMQSGIKHCKAKFTDKIIQSIFNDAANGVSIREMSKKYGTAYTTIRSLLMGKTYKNSQKP